jgi:putative ABC transport system permease protein
MQQFAASSLFAFRSVVRHRRRSAFAVAAIACGVVATILAGSFIQWIFWAAQEGAIQNGLGHIEVTRHGFQAEGVRDPNKFLLPRDAEELRALRNLEGVKTVAPRLSFSGLVSHGDATISFLGEGVDPASERNFGEASVVIRGEPLSSDDPEGALLGEGLASNLGVDLGDPLVLLVTTPSGAVNAVEVKVRGLMGTISKAYDDSAIRISIDSANRLLRLAGAHSWVMVLNRTSDTDDMLQSLRGRYAGQFDFVPWHERADFYKKTVTLLSKQMAVVKIVIALVIMLMIANSLMMAVMERTSEIGTCMALGTTARSILTQFVVEAAVLGMVGALLGATLGVALAHLISFVGIPMPPPPGQSRGYVGKMLATTPLVLEACALALTTALLAAILPAWKAAGTQIVAALRAGR